MDEELIDLEINGSGGSAGGNYNNVIIQGNGKIDGDLNLYSNGNSWPMRSQW